MSIIGVIIGVAFAFVALGALGLIALFFACDRAAEWENKKAGEK